MVSLRFRTQARLIDSTSDQMLKIYLSFPKPKTTFLPYLMKQNHTKHVGAKQQALPTVIHFPFPFVPWSVLYPASFYEFRFWVLLLHFLVLSLSFGVCFVPHFKLSLLLLLRVPSCVPLRITFCLLFTRWNAEHPRDGRMQMTTPTHSKPEAGCSWRQTPKVS